CWQALRLLRASDQATNLTREATNDDTCKDSDSFRGVRSIGSRDHPGRPNRKEGNHALRDPLYFPPRAEPGGFGSRHGHLAGGGRDYPELEGRENARQDVSALHSLER